MSTMRKTNGTRGGTEAKAKGTVEPKYGSVSDLAAYSALSEGTIRNLINSGELKAHRVRRRVVIAYSDFDDYMQKAR